MGNSCQQRGNDAPRQVSARPFRMLTFFLNTKLEPISSPEATARMMPTILKKGGFASLPLAMALSDAIALVTLASATLRDEMAAEADALMAAESVVDAEVGTIDEAVGSAAEDMVDSTSDAIDVSVWLSTSLVVSMMKALAAACFVSAESQVPRSFFLQEKLWSWAPRNANA